MSIAFGRDEANLFFHVIAKRYERAATIVTSNLPFTQWALILADEATLTAALLDRLLHHAHIVQISGASCRMKDKRRGGTLGRRKREEPARQVGPFYFGDPVERWATFTPALTLRSGLFLTPICSNLPK